MAQDRGTADEDTLEGLRTELARARAELARARDDDRWHAHAAAVAGVGFFDWDPREPVAVVSDTLYQLYGFPPGEAAVTFEWWMERLHGADRAAAIGDVQRSLVLGIPYESTYRVMWEDGSVHWIHARADVTHDEGGRAIRFRGAATDVTDRVASGLELDRFFGLSSDLMCILGREGRLRRWNEAFATRFFGAGPGNAIPLAELVAEEDRTAARAALAAATTGSALECRMRDAAGAELTLAWRFACDEGLIFAVGRDVTDARELQRRLSASERLASIGTLAAGVAHEINNPLAYVLANLEVAIGDLRDAELSFEGAPEIINALSDARHGVDRVGEIVRDLRVMARVKDDSSVAPVDVAVVMDRALAIATSELRHRARVVRSYGKVARARGNETRIGQVLLNLISNAAQAIPLGSVGKNEVRVEIASTPDGSIKVTVADTGVGMSPEVLARIFEPFFTTKPIGEGTGLGLAICRELMTSMGGSMSVESRVGRGTVFTTVFPAWKGSVVEAAATEKPRVELGRVLIIDDDARVGRAVARLFPESSQVDVVTHPKVALERLLTSDPPDLILCDVAMPEITGPQLEARLREQKPDAASRMIFMTGGATTRETQQFLDEHEGTILEKPFDRADLEAMVAQFLGSTL